MDRTERHTNYPNLFRSTSLIHYLLVIFHWNGCLYHIIYKNNGFGSKNWVFSDSETADVVKQYLQSYYWCTLALTTIGDLPRYFYSITYLRILLHIARKFESIPETVTARLVTSCVRRIVKKNNKKERNNRCARIRKLLFVQTFKSRSSHVSAR